MKPTASSNFFYYLAAWLCLTYGFGILDFSKRIDDLLFGLNFAELCVNFLIASSLFWALSLVLAITCLGLERLGSQRPPQFLLSFCFFTINYWSLKVGFASRLATWTPHQLQNLAVCSFTLVLFITLALTRCYPTDIPFLRQRAKQLIALFMGSQFLLSGGLFFPPSLPSNYPASSPSIILITFDALNPLHTSAYGYARRTTPNLEALAKDSWVFTNVHSTFTNTPPCLASLQGVKPVVLPSGQVAMDERGLFQILGSRDYPYRAFFGSYAPGIYFPTNIPGSALTRSGMHNPFYQLCRQRLHEPQLRWLAGLLSDEWSYYWPFTKTFDDDIFWSHNHHPADISFQSALAFLERHPQGAFVWVHLWEPHYPYWPDNKLTKPFGPSPVQIPAKFTNTHYTPEQAPWVASEVNRYDQTLLSADLKLGRFLDRLKQLDLYQTSYLIVASDHGESFQQGYLGHAGSLVLEGITRIPLIIHPPGNIKPKSIAVNASSYDLAPTLLELLKFPPARHLPGESLLPYALGTQKQSARFKFTYSVDAFKTKQGQVAVYWTHYKAVYWKKNPHEIKIYDLTSDPLGTRDITSAQPQLKRHFIQAIDEELKSNT